MKRLSVVLHSHRHTHSGICKHARRSNSLQESDTVRSLNEESLVYTQTATMSSL